MMNFLNLTLTRFSDRYAELNCSIKYKGFLGSGTSSVELTSFRKDATLFAGYPIAEHPIPTIGSEISATNTDSNKSTLTMSLFPFDNRGNLALRMRVMEDSGLNIGSFTAELNCEIVISYEKARELSQCLVALADQSVEHCVIQLF